MKVNFMILGAQKCGTTTLAQILRSHPSLVMSQRKEPHFFSKTRNWRNELAEYHKLFNRQEGALYFESSVSYTVYPLYNLGIWDDIFDYNPDMKFIYIVRNPIDRITSSYMHSFERWETNLTFEKALITERFLIDMTRYYTQIFPFIEKFGRDKVHIIDFEDMVQDVKKVLEQISDFLSIDSSLFSDFSDTHRNKSLGGNKLHHKYIHPSLPLKVIRKFFPPIWKRLTDNSERAFYEKPVLDPDYRKMILNMLKLEIEKMQEIMNKDLSKWFCI